MSQQSAIVAQHVGTPRDPTSTRCLYITVWEDVESIRAFAGERGQEAVIDPDDENLLNGARLAFRHDGREAEEAVADVMDFLVGWSSSHMRVQTFPQLGSSLRYAVHPAPMRY